MRLALVILAGLLWLAAPAAASTKVDYGPISHKGLKKLGKASTSQKLPLQIGLIANQSGLQNAVKSASNPSSSSYGKYPSLSTLQSKYGASSSKRKGVVNAFKKQSVKATVDVTHLRVSATPTIGKAQKLFGTKWAVYKAKSGAHVALPVNTPKLPSGIKGNVDTVAGMRLQLTNGSSSATTSVVVDGGTPTRTGTPALGCTPTTFPAAALSGNGLFPNQILTAYGIAPLQAAGLQGQGARLAIVGEAPTPASDVNTFRSCFGTTGTSLKIHNAGSIKPIVESSLDAMVSSMVAPKLASFDLWVHPLSEERRRRRRPRLPPAARPAAPGDDERRQAAERHLRLLRHVRVDRRALHRVGDDGRAPADRDGRAGDHHRRGGGRQRVVGVRARRLALEADLVGQEAAGVMAGDARRGCSRSAART